MEYYTLSRYAYLKYYVLILYYRLAEYPPVVRAWAIFATIALLVIVFIMIHNLVKAFSSAADARQVQKAHEKYYQPMKQVALTTRAMDNAEIIQLLGLPKNFKMKEKQNRRLFPVLQELYMEVHDSMSRINWQRLLQALKMPAYFEAQVRSSSMRKRVLAFKNVSAIDANLKEATASRYLYSKNRKLQNCARIHTAQFGTSYPFKALEEDPNLVFTEELMVKYHNVLVYRKQNGLTIPNLIRWVNRVPVNEELRLFAINEIRIFQHREDCEELLGLLQNSRDEKVSCAIIKALGEMDYVPAEKEFLRRYLTASFNERQTLAEALGDINSGSPEVLQFLVDDFKQTSDYLTRMKVLRVIHDYGKRGKDAFDALRLQARPEYSIYFEHIDCNLIDSRRYA